MGLFDEYFDPQQLPDSGGLPGRLLALQQQRGQYQPDPDFDQSPSVPQPPAPMSMLSPMSANFGSMPSVPQGLAGQQGFSNTGDADPSGDGLADSEASGQPTNLSEAAYRETSANANQVAGELQGIQQNNEKDVVSGKDYISGVREGNVRRNSDESLDVANGTVVTYSYKDGRAKTVTVTNTDVAHIDPKTGEVVIQKSPLGDGI